MRSKPITTRGFQNKTAVAEYQDARRRRVIYVARTQAGGTGAVDCVRAGLQESYARSGNSSRLRAPLWLPSLRCIAARA